MRPIRSSRAASSSPSGVMPGPGVNLRRVFTEPREFDLVLWVQGTAAVPYLEAGEVTTPRSGRGSSASSGASSSLRIWSTERGNRAIATLS